MAIDLHKDNDPAPELKTVLWFNTEREIKIEDCRGKVIVLHTFQMLCPSCVLHGLPQTQRIFNLFPKAGVVVIGVHTVFEHHEAMTPSALKSFLYEFKYTFPVAIDAPGPSGSAVPLTMRDYQCRGTPTLILIDKKGFIRKHYFGSVDDMQIGAEIMLLMAEKA